MLINGLVFCEPEQSVTSRLATDQCAVVPLQRILEKLEVLSGWLVPLQSVICLFLLDSLLDCVSGHLVCQILKHNAEFEGHLPRH